MRQEKVHLINGTWTSGQGPLFQSLNPCNGDVLWEGKEASEAEVDAAVQAAAQAFESWSDCSIEQRISYLELYREELEKKRDALSISIAEETGKPLWECKGEVGAMIGKIAISIQAQKERCGLSSKDLPAARAVLRHKPHGVLGIFGPFNFPGHLPNGHIVPALLAGNTVVLKPSELTPRVAEQMIQCWEAAKLPPGVLNLVQGGKITGKALAQHSLLNGLLFTGSAQTGLLLHEQFGRHPEKILALELGGNNPLIAWDVSDPSAAAYQIIQSAFLTSGQRCTCARRLILPTHQEGNEILEIILEMMKGLQVGSPFEDPQPFMGPVISVESARQIESQALHLEKNGGQWLQKLQALGEESAFLQPGIMDVTNIEQRPDEEVFGPFLQVIRVQEFSAAIQEANDTRFGLSAGILTDDPQLHEQFLRKSRAGIVNWNTQTTGASSAAPFGGIGHSGNHRPSAYYAADYCNYPVASMEVDRVQLPETLVPGFQWNPLLNKVEQ